MLNARYPQLTEDLEIAYALNGKGPLSRPFFSLSLNNTSRLLLALVILAQDSEEKGFEETTHRDDNACLRKKVGYCKDK